MFFVLCPCCESQVEVLPSAFGADRTRLSTVVVCELCDTAFDCDDDAVIEDDDFANG
jgi:hypothetical protein